MYNDEEAVAVIYGVLLEYWLYICLAWEFYRCLLNTVIFLEVLYVLACRIDTLRLMANAVTHLLLSKCFSGRFLNLFASTFRSNLVMP